jgi:protein-disulfide isomerase
MAAPRKQRTALPRKVTAPQQGQHRPFIVAGALIIAVLVVAIVVVVIRSTDDSGTTPATMPSGPVVAPAASTTGGALTAGNAAAPVRLEVFLDYMCPYCGRFDRANAAELERLVGDGTVRLELYPLAFLDDMSRGTQYSTRAANAAATVADRAPDKLLAFNQVLFNQQPHEQTDGLSDQQIAQWARGAGVPDDVVATFTDRRFAPWIAQITQKVMGNEITGTPTVRINGARYEGDLFTAGELTKAVQAAKE